MANSELFDVVELLLNLPEQGLQAGAQGAIVQVYPDQTYEVEFTNNDGETISLIPLRSEQFVVVWRSQTKTWVPVADRFQALMVTLPEDALQEVFDFAKSLQSQRLAS